VAQRKQGMREPQLQRARRKQDLCKSKARTEEIVRRRRARRERRA